MELRQLRHFVMLAETLNFHRASERLHISQPPLTVSIKKLETEMGVALFERTSQGVKLTAAGVAALANAKRAIFFAEETRRSAVAIASGKTGLLRLGFIGSANHSSMPRVIKKFRSLYPGVELQLQESSMMDLLHRVESGLIDIAFIRVGYPMPEDPHFDLTLLEKDHFVVAVPSDNPFAGRSALRLAELRNEPFIGYSEAIGPVMRSLWSKAFQLAGFQPDITQNATQVQTILSLVASGLGVALVPSSLMRQVVEGVHFAEVEGFRASMMIGLAMATHRNARSSAATMFLEVALDPGIPVAKVM